MKTLAYALVLIAALFTAALAYKTHAEARHISMEITSDLRAINVSEMRFNPIYGDSIQNERLTAIFNDTLRGVIRGRELAVQHERAVTTFRFSFITSICLFAYLVVLRITLKRKGA